MAGRKPIGEQAMTNAERQKRWRDRHRLSTPSEKFRHKIFWLIRWFSLWLSEDEIRETLEAFGMAWNMDQFLANETGKAPTYLDRVYFGEDINGNRGDRLGDEERYRRERVERLEKSQKADEEFKRLWNDLLQKHNGDKRRAAGELIAGIVI